MGALAKKYNAVNLSQGFPDFNCSEKLTSALTEAMLNGHNQYAPMQGILPLRESIAQKTSQLYGRSFNPETEITVVPGATIQKGDEVIVIEPAYDCYVPAIELCGGIAVYSSLVYPEFKVNWDEIESLISSKTKMIIINSPHNPGTSVFSKDDLDNLARLTRNTNILILSDEVYEHMIFDGLKHQSVALSEELSERSFIVSSFGKTYHVTGWKTGYVMAPASMTTEFRKVYQYNAFCSFAPAQWAFNTMLQDESSYLQVSAFYEAKRDKMVNLLSESRFNILPSKGSYFQLLDYSKITDENDYAFARRLIIEHQIATIPLSSFYHDKTDNKLLRICFAKEDETLIKAANILNRL
jgi:methionine transaminase